MIAQKIALEDLPSRDEILTQDDKFEKFDTLLIDKRDQKLIDTIERLHDAAQNEKKIIGIVYGAMHMRHVANFLFQKWHYSIAKAEWAYNQNARQRRAKVGASAPRSSVSYDQYSIEFPIRRNINCSR